MSSIESTPLWQVDAFTDRPFRGNPAAICLLQRYPGDEWLQNVASEMNLSETAFIVPSGDANRFDLRWFTPACEVDLCGHATLAAAHTLIKQNLIDGDLPIRFQTRSGELLCIQSESRITLDFPATPASGDVDRDTADALLLALGIREASVLQSAFDLVVVVEAASIVESLRPNFYLLGQVETRGVMVTAASENPKIDFVSRFFAPRCRIDEDPVTGSAHCCLAPYWAERLGKTSLVGYQASSRGGTVHCECISDRVRLTGQAITVMQGHLTVDSD